LCFMNTNAGANQETDVKKDVAAIVYRHTASGPGKQIRLVTTVNPMRNSCDRLLSMECVMGKIKVLVTQVLLLRGWSPLSRFSMNLAK